MGRFRPSEANVEGQPGRREAGTDPRSRGCVGARTDGEEDHRRRRSDRGGNEQCTAYELTSLNLVVQREGSVLLPGRFGPLHFGRGRSDLSVDDGDADDGSERERTRCPG